MKVKGAIAAVVVLAIFAGWYWSPSQRDMRADRAAVEWCRKAQNDELSDMPTRRTMREVCDGMYKDYQAKWGRDP